MNHSELVHSLLTAIAPVVQDFPLLYDMSYRKPGPTGDEPKVSAPKVDPSLPQGDAKALRALRIIQDRSTVALVRLAYVLELHGLPLPALPVGEGQAPVYARLRAIEGALGALAALPALRADKAAVEQLTGRFSSPSIGDCIAHMADALAIALPRATAAELSYKVCVVCQRRPTTGNRKRCTRCHTWFAKHGAERPISMDREESGPICAQPPDAAGSVSP